MSRLNLTRIVGLLRVGLLGVTMGLGDAHMHSTSKGCMHDVWIVDLCM